MSSEKTVQVGGDYWDAQLRAFDSLDSGDYDLVVFRGGYGSGKTVFGTRWIQEVSMNIPKSDNLVLAPDATKGGPTTYKTFFEQLPGDNTVPDEGGDPENSPIVKEYNAVERRVTFINGSVVRLGSADVWNRYAGGEFNAIYCDEVAHYENTDLYDLHEMLISRQRTEDGPNVSLWTSTGNGFNQFYDITERQVDPDDNELQWSDSMDVILADSLNNPFLNEKDKLRRQFEGTEREKQALKGGFAAAQGLVYPSFSRNTHVRGPNSPQELPELRETRLYGYDYGWNDPRVLLEIAKTVKDQYAVIDCYYKTQKPVEDAVEWLRVENKATGKIFSDHDPEHIDKFKQAGFGAVAAEKNIDEGIDEVRTVLEVGEEGPGLVVHEDCSDLIQEFQSYKEEHVGTSKAKDHALDALRYAIMGDRYTKDTTVTRRKARSNSFTSA